MMELRSSFTAVKRKQTADDGQPDKTTPNRKKKTVKEQTILIFDFVKSGYITNAVEIFLEIYHHDRMKGLLKVKISIFRFAGCTRKYDPETCGNDKKILSYFEDGNDRQFSLLDAGQKELRENFCKFVRSIIEKCEISNLLYDKVMLKSLLSFFGLMALSEVESFRYTATLSALMTMRALIKIIVRKKEKIRKLDSQLNAEMREPEVYRDIDRLQDLQLSKQNLTNKLVEVQLSVGCLRKKVLETRIIDYNNKIRSICIVEIGEWLKIHPEMVLQDKYIDYLLIPFSNKNEVMAIRKLCSSILNAVFEENSDMVQIFAKDIKNVLLCLAKSNESKLSFDGFRLLAKVSKLGVLEDRDCVQLYKVVYLDHPYRSTAKMAGEVLVGQLEERVKEDFNSGEIEIANTTYEMRLLHHLVHFHIKYGSPGNSAFLVDSLYEWTTIVRDWRSMNMFLKKEKLSDEEEFAILEILSSCIRHATLGQMPEETLIHFARTGTDRRRKFSETFVDYLPLLITRFQDDPAKISNILLTAQCVSLDSYVTLRKENALTELLEEIKVVMNTSSDWKVLKECACAFKALCVKEHSTYAVCAPICDLMVDDIEKKCITACQAITEVEFTTDPQKADDLLSALKRVAAFSGYFNMFNPNLFQFMIQYANSALLSDQEDIIERAKYSFLSCLRFLIAAIGNISDIKKCNDLQINALREMFNEYINAGVVLIDVKDEKVKCEAFQGTCQAILVFSEGMAHTLSFQNLNALVYCPPKSMADLLCKYVRERIFADLPKDDWDAAKEEATMRRKCLHAFCSLLVKSIISDHSVFAEIFGHYLKFKDLFKDIFDGMIQRIKTQDNCNFVLIVHKCLSSEFLKIKTIDKQEEKAEALQDLKKLATHFSKVIGEKKTGPDQQKAIVLLHDEGIEFSMTPTDKAKMSCGAPPNVGYLEILILFVELLMPQGCKHLHRYLRKLEPFRETSHWMAFVVYRNALQNGRVAIRLLPSRRRRRRRRYSSNSDEDY